MPVLEGAQPRDLAQGTFSIVSKMHCGPGLRGAFPWAAVGLLWVLCSVLLQTLLRCESVVCPWRGAIRSLCDRVVMQPSMAVGVLHIGDCGCYQDRLVCLCTAEE